MDTSYPVLFSTVRKNFALYIDGGRQGNPFLHLAKPFWIQHRKGYFSAGPGFIVLLVKFGVSPF